MVRNELPVLAFDCDDVLVLTGQDLISEYNRRHHTVVEPRHLYGTAGIEVWGVDEEEACQRVEALIREERHETLAPTQDMVTAVRSLARFCKEAHVVTSRSYERAAATERLVYGHYTGIFRAIHYANSYSPGTPPELRRTKGSICNEIGADIAIDDNVGHAESVLRESQVQLAIVYGDYAWNRDLTLQEGMVRCTTLPEVEAEVRRFVDRYAA